MVSSDKGQKVLLRRALSKLLDHIDPIEAVAIVGMTVVIKTLVDTTEELAGKMMYMRGVLSGGITRIAENQDRPPPELVGDLWGYIISQWDFAATIIAALTAIGVSEEDAKNYEGMFPDWADWIICMAIAYVIIRHGELLFALGQQMTSVIGKLLG